MQGRTWDGLPISATPPYGAMIVVYRQTREGLAFLLLHRAHMGEDYEGSWAWGPPSGARFPGEAVDHCAQKELCEETGIDGRPYPIGIGGERPVYVLEAAADVRLTLSAEHDRYLWASFEEAVAWIKPAVVYDAFCAAALLLEERYD